MLCMSSHIEDDIKVATALSAQQPTDRDLHRTWAAAHTYRTHIDHTYGARRCIVFIYFFFYLRQFPHFTLRFEKQVLNVVLCSTTCTVVRGHHTTAVLHPNKSHDHKIWSEKKKSVWSSRAWILAAKWIKLSLVRDFEPNGQRFSFIIISR